MANACACRRDYRAELPRQQDFWHGVASHAAIMVIGHALAECGRFSPDDTPTERSCRLMLGACRAARLASTASPTSLHLLAASIRRLLPLSIFSQDARHLSSIYRLFEGALMPRAYSFHYEATAFSTPHIGAQAGKR